MAGPGSGGVYAMVERQLEQLSPRDRKLLVGLVSFGTLAGLGLLWWTLYGLLDDKASRVRTAKSNLETIQVLQVEHTRAAAQLAAQESRLEQYRGRPLSAHIEELASRHGLREQLKGIRTADTEDVGNIQQTRYNVEFKGAEIEATLRFLYELETSGYPVSVEQADFTATSRKQLNLNLELLVFKVAGA